MEFQKFYAGDEFGAYDTLGAHIEGNSTIFRVYAPAAVKVSVIGEFNDWQEEALHRIYDGNFWEGTVRGAREGQMYKYRIYRKDGSFLDHADPYAFYSELRPGTASRLFDMKKYRFRDGEWMKQRNPMFRGPVNIYEMHLGSWRKKSEEQDGWYRYEELPELLIPYLKENGYNYVEFMPLNEYPSDESWGYQATGFYSATSRYGTPDGLRELVDQCHRNGIGVILDIVNVHFAVNDYALWNFDGTALYEYPNDAVGKSEWGSCNFMHSRGDVCSFLQSAANFWMQEYHFDGLRMDAVGNLIYWQGNRDRGENKDAILFLKRMNQGLKRLHPDAMLIAEDSTAYVKVTAPVEYDGLGFDYKWDMGWMNDTLRYFQESPKERVGDAHKLTFSMDYAYNEHYVLPLSHDEVVHGKATIVQKMSALYEGKFASARALYLYMYMHPGKKLDFMGNEIGQMREWDEKKEQDWMLLKYPMHDSFHHFMMDLNHLYLAHPALYDRDYDRRGFAWVSSHQEEQSVFAFLRCAENGEVLLGVFNFSDQPHSFSYAPGKGKMLKLLLNSDEAKYSGSGAPQEPVMRPDRRGNVTVEMPLFSAKMFQICEKN